MRKILKRMIDMVSLLIVVMILVSVPNVFAENANNTTSDNLGNANNTTSDNLGNANNTTSDNLGNANNTTSDNLGNASNNESEVVDNINVTSNVTGTMTVTVTNTPVVTSTKNVSPKETDVEYTPGEEDNIKETDVETPEKTVVNTPEQTRENPVIPATGIIATIGILSIIYLVVRRKN